MIGIIDVKKTNTRISGLLILFLLLTIYLSLGISASPDTKTRFNIQGSNSVEPIARIFTEYLTRKNPNLHFDVEGKGSSTGARALISGQTDLATMSRFMSRKEFQTAVENNIRPVFHTVARDGIALIVHKSNPVTNLSIEQIRKIYSGEIENWQEVGGKNLPIMVIGRDINSGTRKVFEKTILKGSPLKQHQSFWSTRTIQEQVVKYPNGIGYIARGYLLDVKTLRINGIKPNFDTITNGTYPLTRPLFFVTNGYPKINTVIHTLTHLHQTPKGKQMIRDLGWFIEAKYQWKEQLLDFISNYWPYLATLLLFIFGLVYLSYHQTKLNWTLSRTVSERDEEIRARMELVNTLEEQRNFAESLIESLHQIILLSDKDGNIIRANSSFTRITGYTFDEVREKSFFKIFYPEGVREDLLKTFQVFLNSNKDYNHTSTILTKSGQERKILWHNKIQLDLSGDRKTVLSTGLDITEQQELENRVRQAEKMEAIGHLAGGIAHDFNNILAAIIGFAELSIQKVKKGSVIGKNLSQIIQAGDRARILINQILTFSRQSKGQKKAVFIKPVIMELASLLDASTPAALVVKTKLEREKRPVMADLNNIHQVIMNIATNAIYAMRENGTLSIHLSEVLVEKERLGRIGLIKTGEYSLIQIIDTGCGIDEKTMDKMFEPFYTTKPVGEGTGMGLSVVMGIIQSHGGNIQVESYPGEGTIFRIYLPKSEKIAGNIISKRENKALSGTEKILLVDDEKLVNKAIKSALQHIGYKVSGITNSPKALDTFKDNPEGFDLIITDFNMPKMTGIELTKKVKEIRGDIPVLLISGNNSKINPNRAKSLGIDKILDKPFLIKELGQAIREVLDRSDSDNGDSEQNEEDTNHR